MSKQAKNPTIKYFEFLILDLVCHLSLVICHCFVPPRQLGENKANYGFRLQT